MDDLINEFVSRTPEMRRVLENALSSVSCISFLTPYSRVCRIGYWLIRASRG